MSKQHKKNTGQFYTVNSTYILDGLTIDTSKSSKIIEPFAGHCDLINWLETNTQEPLPPIELYDIEPKKEDIVERDTLQYPPDYKDVSIITNPPYLARNKCDDKTIFDKYNTNDLYKAFITSLTQQEHCCSNGIFIIPSSFFLSSRDIDVRCRDAFLSKYKLLKVKFFEERVFPDTATTVVAFSFEKSKTPLTTQNVEWIQLPTNKKKVFTMDKKHDWIIGGDIYKLPIQDNIKIRRYVLGQKLKENEQITEMTLSALDSGTQNGRICIEFKENYKYPAKECSRTYATLCCIGRTLTREEQKHICSEFTRLIEEKREETWSLFLPSFREAKEYARKRIPFELAYRIVNHLIVCLIFYPLKVI